MARRRLDDIVRDHRVTITVVVPLVGAITLIASASGWLPGLLTFNAVLILIGTAVMRLPVIAALAPLTTRRAAIWLMLLIGFTYTIEWIGVTTGWPYGSFSYTIALGPMIGGIPVALPLFFIPLVANAYLLATLWTTDRSKRLGLALVFLIMIDLVLDPGAVALGFWTFESADIYGVPLTNFLGWLFSGSIALYAIDRAFGRDQLSDRLEECEFALDDLVSFLVLWGIVNLLAGQLLSVAIGMVLAGLWFARINHHVPIASFADQRM